MSTIDVTAGLTGIDFYPSTVEAEVIQNVRSILATRKGTVPIDRSLGVSWDMLDRPLPVARAMMIAEVFEAVAKYEPRAEVVGVSFDDDIEDAMDGVLHPVVTIRIDEGSSVSSSAQAQADAAVSAADARAESSSARALEAAAAAEQAAALAASIARTVDMSRLSDIETRLSDIETADYTSIMDGDA